MTRLLFFTLLTVGGFLFVAIVSSVSGVRNAVPPETAAKPQPLRIAFYTVGLGVGYFNLALDLFNSASQYFCTNAPIQVDFFVFSNQPAPDDLPSNYHLIPTVKRGWPYDSQDRFKWMFQHAADDPALDYILWMDADQRFERPVCYDMLGELVAVAHSHYVDSQKDGYPYESRPESRAYVPAENGRVQNYFSCHFFGGTYSKMMLALRTMYEWLEEDLKKDIHARVEDESYLNAYFYYNFPTVVLSRIFVWPEGYENKLQWVLNRHGGRDNAAAIARYMKEEDKPRSDE
jgi:hypothetical protein